MDSVQKIGDAFIRGFIAGVVRTLPLGGPHEDILLLRALKQEFPEATQEQLEVALTRAVDWLCRSPHRRVNMLHKQNELTSVTFLPHVEGEAS